jgi:hypothetical protein
MSHATETAKGLHALADAIESGALPLPFDVEVNVHWLLDGDRHITEKPTADTARAAMAALPGAWNKRYLANYVVYERDFGGSVVYSINLNREDICRKVMTGTKHVDAIEAHDEPVYEWVCEAPE